MLGGLVKFGWQAVYLWRWYDQNRVNVFSFHDQGAVLISIDKPANQITMYYFDKDLKWESRTGKDLVFLSKAAKGPEKDSLQRLGRLVDMLEFNLAVPIKGVMWRTAGENCRLESVSCLRKSFWPVGPAGSVKGNMSWGHRLFWWVVSRGKTVKVKKVSFRNGEFDKEKWDGVWQSGLRYSGVEVAVFSLIKSKRLINWYTRSVENLGWRVVQVERVDSDWLSRLNGASDEVNYCLWVDTDKKPQDKLRLEIFLRCVVSDKIEVVNARSDLAIIVNSFIW